MSELEKNVPDDYWRKAFEEANEMPPPRVWDNIERRLDESDGPKILPLWGTGLASSRPFVWGVGIAATVALLLVGWWAMSPQSTNQPIARVKRGNPAENVATTPAPSSTKASRKQVEPNPEAIASANRQPKRPERSLEGRVSRIRVLSPDQSAEELVLRDVQRPRSQADNTIAQTKPTSSAIELGTMAMQQDRTALLPTEHVAPSAASNRVSVVNRDVVASTEMPLNVTLNLEPLVGQPLRLRELGQIHRIVWFRPYEAPLEAEISQSSRESREVWASVSMMPGAYNPSVSIRQAQPAYALASSAGSKTNQTSINSRANFSVAYQAGAGVQLTEHWSIESGVGYLAGRSTVESPGQFAAANIQSMSPRRDFPVSNLYVDALRNSTGNSIAKSSSYLDIASSNNNYTLSNNYNAQMSQVLTNNYQFVQVPVQVGYQIRPRKRLSMAVLGGLLTNIFVRNTVGDDLVVTAQDGVYRPVSFAATMGARFRYRPSRRWSASVAGVYQPSLGLGTQTGSQVESRPTSTGMSFGVDYHF
ncbi:hypothetical protein ACFSUS_25360 [Spirosoma soli]|uniref:Outer membrane beta-barrel protein n=1 Tax=Spirosoma soli TaxID=1770529 RepID=A0ABW5MAF8_9BACT